MNITDLLMICLRLWLFGAVVYLTVKYWHVKEVSLDVRALGAWGISGFLMTLAFFSGNTIAITLAGTLINLSLVWLLLTVKVRK